MIRPDNYIHISGWMVTDLGLKGNDLLVYALVYGFSQDGESEFRGTISYIMEWLNCSKMTVLRSLQALTENGLLLKRDIEIAKNLKLAYYSANVTAVTKCYWGRSQNVTECGNKMLPNNNINNTKRNTNNIPPPIEEVRAYCSERNKGVDPDKWYDFYQSKGWKVGKNPMKDWKASVRTWENKQTRTVANRFNQFPQRTYDYDSLEARLLQAQK